MRWVSLVFSSGCLAATPVMHFGGGAQVAQSQRSEIERETAGSLDSSSRWTGPVRTGHVRVWADDDYRVQNLDWQRSFGHEIEVVNNVIGPMMGLRLEPEFHTW